MRAIQANRLSDDQAFSAAYHIANDYRSCWESAYSAAVGMSAPEERATRIASNECKSRLDNARMWMRDWIARQRAAHQSVDSGDASYVEDKVTETLARADTLDLCFRPNAAR